LGEEERGGPDLIALARKNKWNLKGTGEARGDSIIENKESSEPKKKRTRMIPCEAEAVERRGDGSERKES